MVTASLDAAQRAVEETRIVRPAAEDQRRSAEALLNQPPLAPGMDRARDARARPIRDWQ